MEKQLEDGKRVQPAIERRQLEKLLRECLQLVEEHGGFEEHENPLAVYDRDEQEGTMFVLAETSEGIAVRFRAGGDWGRERFGSTLTLGFLDDDSWERAGEIHDLPEEVLESTMWRAWDEGSVAPGIEIRGLTQEQLEAGYRTRKQEEFNEPDVRGRFNEWFESSELVRDPRTGKPSYAALGELMGVSGHTAKRYLSGESLPKVANSIRLSRAMGEESWQWLLYGETATEARERTDREAVQRKLAKEGEGLLEGMDMPTLEKAVGILRVLAGE